MGVYLREKKLGNGEVSFYLDIYHCKKRWYEFIGIHISKSHPTADDKEKRRLAQKIRIKRENELIVQDNGLIDKSKSKADFISWFENHIKGKRGKSNQMHNTTALTHLKNYLGNRPLPFLAITPEWIKGFIDYLRQKSSKKYCSPSKANQCKTKNSTSTTLSRIGKQEQSKLTTFSLLVFAYNDGLFRTRWTIAQEQSRARGGCS